MPFSFPYTALSILTNLPDNPSAGVARQVKFKLYFSVYSSHFLRINVIISIPNF